MKYKKSFLCFVILFLLVMSSFSVFAGAYGLGRYGLGVYGQGENEGGGGGGGVAAGGGGGSGSSKTVQGTSSSILRLLTPNDLPGDIAESSLDMTCASGPCKVTSSEVKDLPSNIAAAYTQKGGQFIAAVRLICEEGELGRSDMVFDIESSAGASCDNLVLSKVEDDGSSADLDADCTENEDGSLHVEASFEGCSYLVVWSSSEEARATLGQLEEEGVGAKETIEGGEIEVQPAAGFGGATVLVTVIVLVVVGVVLYLLRKKKKRF